MWCKLPRNRLANTNAKIMDIPSNEAEAREHIAQIRKAKGLDGPENNTSDLEAALTI
jgi:hypothetical protein